MTDEEHEEFDFSKYDAESSPAPFPLDQDMLRRRMVWNVTPCSIAEDVIKSMQLPPASADVEEAEHDEAHARMLRLQPLIPVVFQLTVYAAEAICESLIQSLVPLGIPAESVMDPAVLHPVVLASTLGVMAEMLDIHAIDVHPPIEVVEFPEDV